MAFRLAILLLPVFFLFLYIAYLNPGSVTFVYSPSKEVTMPLSAIVMISFALGSAGLGVLHIMDSLERQMEKLKARFRDRYRRKTEERVASARDTALRGNSKKALSILDKVLSGKPDHFDALVLKGNIQRDAGNIGEALKSHSLALAHRPDDTAVFMQLKEDYTAAGHPAAAYKMLEKARGRSPKNPLILAEMRKIKEAQRDYKFAILIQKELMKIPSSPEEDRRRREKYAQLHYLHAEQLAEKGELTQARAELGTAAKILPNFLPAAILESDIVLMGGYLGEAERILKKEFSKTASLIPLRKLEDIFRKSGKKEKLEELYLWARKTNPNIAILSLFVAMARIENGNYEGAYEILADAGEHLAHFPLYNMALGFIAIKTGSNQKEAAVNIGKAMNMEWNRFLRYRCGTCWHNAAAYFAVCPSCGEWNSASPVFH